MKILYVNWAPMWHGAEVGGGVNLYSKSMSIELAGRGHSVYTVSSGFAYTPKSNVFYKETLEYAGVRNFEIFNSPILAPAYFSFRHPEMETHCPPVEKVFKELISELKPDIVHFHNIEGFTANCITIAKSRGAKVFYSLHNYHLICPQVGLLYQGKTICTDFDNGRKCLNCISPFPRLAELKRRKLSDLFHHYIPMGGRIWFRLMQVASIALRMARKGKSLLRRDVHPSGRPALAGNEEAGRAYALRRKKMIDAVNQADTVLAVSHFVKRLFIEMGVAPHLIKVNHIGNKMAEIGMGIPPFFDPPPPLKMIFLGVADELKGLPFLLKTLATMPSEQICNIELHLYARGIGYQRKMNAALSRHLEFLKESLSSLHIHDGYRFDDLPNILLGMHIGIVPPIWYDNAPQVVFEMLAMKVPVLGARIGGIPDFVKHDENGMLFAPGSVEDLQDKLGQIVMNPVLIEKFKRRITPMKTPHEHVRELETFYGADKKKTENSPYYRWLKQVAPKPENSRKRIQSFDFKPSFSFIVPTYNSRLDHLKETLHSILHQTYPYFEVCISDDASTDQNVINYLVRLSEKESRIRLVLNKKNQGIALNTNEALKAASGDYLVFCDHDDRVEPFALEMFALYINQYPDAEMFYSDEDLMNEKGRRHSPRLQPDWNPEMFTSHMYFMHMICCQKKAADRIGEMSPEFDGAQDYDFFLRITEKARQIIHIPLILYSWRIVDDSLASEPMAKIYAYSSGTRALENALKRRGEEAIVRKGQGTGLGVYRVIRKVSDPSVSHIVAGHSGAIIDAVKSIKMVSSAPMEIIAVIDTASDELLEVLEKDGAVTLVIAPEKANRAQKYNIGAQHATNPTLIFSPEEIEILDSDFPMAMLEHTQRSEIGAVGAKLIYPDGKFYHTGMMLGVNGVAGYGYRNIFQGPGYWRFAVVIRNFSAVSWDLLGVTQEKFNEIGGFDEQLTSYQDVDFCLKLIEKGYRNLYTPYAAGVLKSRIHTLEELRDRDAEAVIMKRYKNYILNDPQYHPLCNREIEDFSPDLWAQSFDSRMNSTL